MASHWPPVKPSFIPNSLPMRIESLAYGIFLLRLAARSRWKPLYQPKLFLRALSFRTAPVHRWRVTDVQLVGRNHSSIRMNSLLGCCPLQSFRFWNPGTQILRKTIAYASCFRFPDRRSSLAVRAEVGAPAAQHDLSDRAAADQTSLPCSHINFVFKLKKTALSIGVHIVGNRRAAQRNRLA